MAKDKQSPDTNSPAKAVKKSSAKKSPAKKSAARNAAAQPASGVSAAAAAKPSQEQLFKEISVRAYEIYCSRGAQHGADEADWLRAEKEIRAKYKI